MIAENAVLLQADSHWLHFSQPQRILIAQQPGEVRAALRAVKEAVEGEGLHAAGFLTYEAATGMDAALVTHPPAALPVLWFGLYRTPEVWTHLPPGGPYALTAWQPSQALPAYRQAIVQIKDAIARGDTYQVNYTIRLHANWQGDPWGLFVDLAAAQRGGYAAFLNLGRHVICSASPELFMQVEGERIWSRPMKGTAARGRTLVEDQALAAQLAASVKDQAENIMIVDMIRNDLGRIARYGSVHVPRLLEIERYPTVLQMTSTVAAASDAALDEVLAALFPCASITGAPKVRTMQLINRLEAGPRGVYTGAIGYLAPQRRARFSVAIRTVTLDLAAGEATYGVGSGIVWDSDADAEYAECLLKAQVLTRRFPQFELLETLRWTAAAGCVRLEGHLARLAAAATYFDFVFDAEDARARLHALDPAALPDPARLRLLLARDGTLRVEAQPLTLPMAAPLLRLRLAAEAVDSTDPFLYHKTTQRTVYERARAAQPDCDEVLLWNERGELTEATTANVVLVLEGRWVTPPVSSGLLPGILRGELLAAGHIHEQVITVEQVRRARTVYLINSLRGWRAGEMVR